MLWIKWSLIRKLRVSICCHQMRWRHFQNIFEKITKQTIKRLCVGGQLKMRFHNWVMHLICLINICLQIGVVVEHSRQAKRGRGWKPSGWAYWLYAPLLEEFARLRAVGVKLSLSILQKLIKLLIVIPQNKYNHNYRDPHNIIQSHKIVLLDWQYFAEYSSHSYWMWGILCRTNNFLHNIPHIQSECGNILQNIVSPTKHCYGSE